MRLRVGARTDTGRVRELNEDVYLVRAERRLFVVCDGMGGAPAGEVASDLAAKAILEQFDAPDMPMSVGSNGENGYLPQTSRLAAAVRHSNQLLYSRACLDPRH